MTRDCAYAPHGCTFKYDPSTEMPLYAAHLEGHAMSMPVTPPKTPVNVPPVKGYSLPEARAALMRAGLGFEEKLVWSNMVPAGIVSGSDPAEGSPADPTVPVILEVTNGPKPVEPHTPVSVPTGHRFNPATGRIEPIPAPPATEEKEWTVKDDILHPIQTIKLYREQRKKS